MICEQALEVANAAIYASAGRQLSHVETLILKGAWQNLTYAAIAKEAGYSVRYIKGDIGAKFWKLLSHALGESVSKTNFRAALERYAQRIEDRGFGDQAGTIEKHTIGNTAAIAHPPTTTDSPIPAQRNPSLPLTAAVQSSASGQMPQCDWGEAIDVSLFYGRTEEFNTLLTWINVDRCRLIAILGMGGIGKTALSVKLAQRLGVGGQGSGVGGRGSGVGDRGRDGKFAVSTASSSVSEPFQFIIWKSLRNAPPLQEVLSDLIFFLSNQQDTEMHPNRLMYWLRTFRCLVVLDNVETIMQPGNRAGFYQVGYENYGELFRAIGEAQHQSCVILTSREKPIEVAELEGIELWVRSMQLSGSVEIAQALIEATRLTGTDDQKQQLCQLYGYNPLALKIVSTSIRDLFDGEIHEFLTANIAVFSGIRRLLEQQFDRLSPLEQSIMYWLAINREWTSIADLAEDLFPSVSRPEVLAALESLSWRSLIEKVTPKAASTASGRTISQYTQQPVVMDYVIEQVIEQVCREIKDWDIENQPQQTVQTETFTSLPSLFTPNSRLPTPHSRLPLLQTHALLKTTVKDYVRESQSRLILEPIAHQLRDSFSSDAALAERFQIILDRLRQETLTLSGYAAGNLINLCSALHIDLTGYDFSRLSVWHACLQTVNLHRVNFAHADLSKSILSQTFGYVLSVAMSPDGSLVATGDGNGQIRLWRSTDGQPISTLQEGYTSWIWSVAFSPDGQTLASGSVDQTIQLWAVQTNRHLATLRGHQNWVRSVAWSPDGEWLASGSTDRTVRIWNCQTGECIQILDEQEDAVWTVAWHPNGRLLATGNHNATLKIWNVQTGACLAVLRHRDWVRSVAWSPDGKFLASGADDHTVRIWDGETGQCLKELTGHTNAIWSVKWNSQGQTLVSVSHDQTVRVWDAVTGHCLKRLLGHTNWVWDVAWSLDGNCIVTVAHDRTIKLWDTQTWSCLRTIRGHTVVAMCLAWSPDGKTLAGSCDDHVVRLWNCKTGKLLQSFQGHTRVTWSVDWSPDGKTIASSSDDHTVRVWNSETGECLHLLQHEHWVWSIAWHPNGKWLATGSQDYCVRIWDIRSRQCIQVLKGHTDSIWCVAWSPDGKTLASSCDDHTIRLWNPTTGECTASFHHEHSVRRIAWSPDGKTIASSSADPLVRLWNVSTQTCTQTLTGHTNALWTVAWHPAGTYLASGGDDQTIRVWDLATGICVHLLEGHTSQIWSIAWSPDGQTIASSSADRTILLWDSTTGTQTQTLRATRPYEGMIITGISGITEAQEAALKALGAAE
jgi:WD40 repeat protein